MNNLKRFLIILISLTFTGSCVTTKTNDIKSAADNKFDKNSTIITVATTADWPPMEMLDKDNQIIGFDIDFFNAIAQEMGLKVEYKNVKWEKLFSGLIDGKYDAAISSITITNKRKKMFGLSTPYIRGGQILVALKKMNDVNTIQDLEGRKIGIHNVTVGALTVENQFNYSFIKYANINKAFEDLAKGKIGGVICDAPLAATYTFHKDSYKNMFKVIGEPLTEEYYGIAVGKEDKELLNMIDKAIRAVQSKGVDEKLTNKWLRPE